MQRCCFPGEVARYSYPRLSYRVAIDSYPRVTYVAKRAARTQSLTRAMRMGVLKQHVDKISPTHMQAFRMSAISLHVGLFVTRFAILLAGKYPGKESADYRFTRIQAPRFTVWTDVNFRAFRVMVFEQS